MAAIGCTRASGGAGSVGRLATVAWVLEEVMGEESERERENLRGERVLKRERVWENEREIRRENEIKGGLN